MFFENWLQGSPYSINALDSGLKLSDEKPKNI